MSVLKLSRVEKSFGSVKVLHNIDFFVGEGEMVSLLGPSGCGKSTTLRCIAGFESISGGEIRIDETLVSSGSGTVPPEKRNLGIIFQSYAVWPHMTVFDNVAFGLKTKRVARDEVSRRVEEVLDLVGLGGMGPRYSATLSGGQQQRVAIARSLVVQPAVLLFDEPLSNLDAKLRDRMRVEIRALQQRIGITAIYVTHDQIEALTMSDRIMLMDSGRIVESGTPAELFNRPRTEFAARFLGMANVWAARKSATRPGIIELEGGLPLRSCMTAEAEDFSVMVRPSCIEAAFGVTRSDPQVEEGNTVWPGVVSKSTFLGETTELLCDVNSCAVLVTALTHKLPNIPAPGDAVTLSIPASQVRVLGGSEKGGTPAVQGAAVAEA